MTHRFRVKCEIRHPGQNYSGVARAMKELNASVTSDPLTWVAAWSGTALELQTRIERFLGVEDRVIVTEINDATDVPPPLV